MKPNCPLFVVCLTLAAGLHTASAELLAYEPFDYAVHNDEVFGRLEGRNGGIGFAGAWQDSGGRGNEGYAFVYDGRGNPEDLFDGGWGQGLPDWDGKVDNLPTMGGYIGSSDWNGGVDRMNSTRKLGRTVGEMADRGRGTVWLSAVWHFPHNHYFAPVGIAFTSGGNGLVERATGIENNGHGIGVGNGAQMRNGMKRLNPMFWANGKDSASTPGTDIDTKQDNIIILKFEFGRDEDKVSAWYFTEDQKMSEREFDQNAITITSSIDEDTLDTLAIGTIRQGNAIDEIRIGTTFKDVISGSIDPRREVKVTRQLYDKNSDRYFVEWTSNPGETYGVYLAEDAGGYKPCVAAAVPADAKKGKTTFGPFDNPRPKHDGLKFEIGLPDLTPPACDRVWGNGTTISLHFTEAMLPGPALGTSNYTVTSDGGEAVDLSAAAFHPGEDTVVLTTATPLAPATGYTVKMNHLVDRANLALKTSEVNFRTWDDNPDGVKVFVLAGQSNMVGRGWYDKGRGEKIGGTGSLRELIANEPDQHGNLLDADGKWRQLPKMRFWWNRADLGGDPRVTKGPMTVGYGAGSDCIGPEYGFGMELEKHYGDQPVLVIKTAWGGKSLHVDYASPTAAAQRDGRIGPYYVQMMDQVHQVLDHLGDEFPEFKGLGYQICGFGWHQGYNDMLTTVSDNAYEANMAMFINDIRAEFGKPKLPFSIATTGHGGMNVTPEQRKTLAGQLNVADPEKYPEFAGNVFTIDTRPLQREVIDSPVEDGSHWHNNGHTLYLMGKGMGEGMVRMLKGE